jgi:hypothetical protein
VDGLTPNQALARLRESLGEHGIQTVGIDLSRSDGLLFTAPGAVAGGKTIGYAWGLYWWRSGRMRHDRPIYAIHPVTDTRGAARRVTRMCHFEWAAGRS